MFRKQRFSIRKFSIGVGSVCISIFLGSQVVQAEDSTSEEIQTVATSHLDHLPPNTDPALAQSPLETPLTQNQVTKETISTSQDTTQATHTLLMPLFR